MNESLRDRVVLLLTNGMTVEAAEGYCVKQGGLDSGAAERLVAEARQRITVAADYARDEQLGKAVMQLDDLQGPQPAPNSRPIRPRSSPHACGSWAFPQCRCQVGTP